MVLLKINWEEAQTIYKDRGIVILNIPYYSKYAIGPTLITLKGETLEDYYLAENKLSYKNIFIGPRGGLSID